MIRRVFSTAKEQLLNIHAFKNVRIEILMDKNGKNFFSILILGYMMEKAKNVCLLLTSKLFKGAKGTRLFDFIPSCSPKLHRI